MGSCVSSHGSKTQNFVIKSSVKDKTPFNHQGIPMKCSPSPSPTTLRDYAGSKEETFFDTQAWLESDCEDEFLSVNGDFTPSRGNTPTHNKRKKLSELFKESVRGARNVVDDQNVKPFLSRANTVHSCERTPPPYGEKSIRSMQCCLPSRSYSESKNKTAPIASS